MKIKHITLVLFLLPVLIIAEEWHVKKSENNLVKFISSTALLDFEGITDNIDGYIYWKGEELFGLENEIYFEVDLNSVETGIGKRDRDMREDVLETDKWPKTSYRGEIKKVEKADGKSGEYKISALGKMFLHGHNKIIPVDAIINISNDEMTVNCNFSVMLEDYEIEAPSLLAFIKVADEIKLQLNFKLEKIVEKDN